MEIAHLCRAKPGVKECGDRVYIHQQDSFILCAVIDGLGHGPGAAKAAEKACECLDENKERELEDIMYRCHRHIKKTHGAAITLVKYDKNNQRLHHAAIGNVELAALGKEAIRPITIPGIVGARVRKVVQTSYKLHKDDLIVIHSDGISGRFELERLKSDSAQHIAVQILENYGKSHDDASCLVLRRTK